MRTPLTTFACCLFLVLALLAPHRPAHAQLRYMGSLDVREQFNSDAFAGVQPEPGVPQQSEPDLITIVEPALRLYYNWPRNLLYLRYGLRLQFHALVQDSNGTQTTTDDGLLFGYANNLDLGYNHMFSHRTELAVVNRTRQGTETTSVSGYVGAGGSPQFGLFTSGNKYVSENVELSLHHQINEQWSIGPRLVAEAYFPYDRDALVDFDADVQSRIIPPPMNQGLTLSTRAQRAFSIGALSATVDLSYIHEYYTPDVAQYQGMFPPHLSTVLGAATLNWRHQLSELWDYTVGAGFDVRLRQQYQASSVAGAPAENTGFDDPGFGPIVEGSVRFRWQRNLAATLSYAHRTQRVIENAVSTASEMDEVGLDFYWIVDPWRFDLFGAFRYMRNENRAINSGATQGDLDDTMLGRASAAVGFLVMPGLSLELQYNFEIANNALAFFANCSQPLDPNTGACPGTQQVQPSSYAYRRHLVTFGVSMAWPPPPPQDVRFNRRESEYDPVFIRDGTSANDDQQQETGLDNPDRVEGRQGVEDDPLHPDNRLDPDGNPRPRN